MQGVLILGATSTLARAVAREYAGRGYRLELAARDRAELEAVAADLRLRYGVEARTHHFDALSGDREHAALFAHLFADPLRLEGVVLCFGYLGEQSVAERDPAEARRLIEINFTSAVAALNEIAAHLERRGSGFICAVSSVAGDRGRPSNYLYGAAKGGLNIYLQGLRGRLFRAGVRVVTIKPGFIDTAMTYGRPGLFLVASPERVARSIYRAVERGRDVVYTPWFWRFVMFVIGAVPEPLFKRLKL